MPHRHRPGVAAPPPRRWGAAQLYVAAGLLLAAAAAQANGIYTCTDDRGRKLTSDRPIPQCTHKEQQLLNRDGSVRAVIPPTPTAEERAEREARERRAAELRAAQADAVRRDRNLLARFPNQEAHDKAREAALDNVRLAIRSTERRLKELAAERQPLLNEAEFYAGKPMPPKLKAQIDANDAALEAQRGAAATQAAELDRINRLYDVELERLRKLWGGAPAGSLGPIQAAAAETAATAPRTGASATR